MNQPKLEFERMLWNCETLARTRQQIEVFEKIYNQCKTHPIRLLDNWAQGFLKKRLYWKNINERRRCVNRKKRKQLYFFGDTKLKEKERTSYEGTKWAAGWFFYWAHKLWHRRQLTLSTGTWKTQGFPNSDGCTLRKRWTSTVLSWQAQYQWKVNQNPCRVIITTKKFTWLIRSRTSSANWRVIQNLWWRAMYRHRKKSLRSSLCRSIPCQMVSSSVRAHTI